MSSPVTSQEVCQLLEKAGFPMTERRLTDWRARGYLPELTHVGGSRHGGQGSFYQWADEEVALQAFTLCAARQIRGRMDTAVVMTWFCGFLYPIAVMRPLWEKFESLPWRYALEQAQAGEKLSDADAVATLVTEAAAATLHPRVSSDFKKTRARILLDPDYEPSRDLTPNQARQIGKDVLELFNSRPAAHKVAPEFLRPADLPQISGDHVRVFISLVHDYWSRPRLVELIETAPADLLVAAHRDCRFLMGLYRMFVADGIARAQAGGVLGWPAAWLAPRLAWQVGRFLLLLDIGLRRQGFESEVDATIASLRSRAEQPRIQFLLAEIWMTLRTALDQCGDSDEGRANLGVQVTAYERLAEVQSVVGDASADLKRIWRRAWLGFMGAFMRNGATL
jgi:hypothetical protein